LTEKLLNKPTASIILPTYNRAKLLPMAINSVLDQTYKNYELIVIDDGSTDNTKQVLKPFQEKIRYIFTDHKGASHARNVGMKAASGRYIAFLDSDDTYLPFKLEIQIDFMEHHSDVGMVYTEISAFSENGLYDEYNLRHYHPTYEKYHWEYEDIFSFKGELLLGLRKTKITYYIGDIFRNVLMGPMIPSPTILFPRKILDVVGFQNEKYSLAEEYEFIVRICKNYKVAFLNIPTYMYRHHDDQISSFAIKNQAEQKKDILRWIEGFSTMLNAVMDWAYSDEKFYSKNRHFINLRISDLYGSLGVKWLQLGNGKKARESFKKSMSFSPEKNKYLKYYYFSTMPIVFAKHLLKAAIKIKEFLKKKN
jgi:glycosyltransferase involved in cell wall biosynthesis